MKPHHHPAITNIPAAKLPTGYRRHFPANMQLPASTQNYRVLLLQMRLTAARRRRKPSRQEKNNKWLIKNTAVTGAKARQYGGKKIVSKKVVSKK